MARKKKDTIKPKQAGPSKRRLKAMQKLRIHFGGYSEEHKRQLLNFAISLGQTSKKPKKPKKH